MGISLRFFRKRKTQPKDYHETYSFLSEDEKVIEKAITKTGKWIWKVVRHGWKLSDRETEFRWDETRHPLLTGKRLILLKNGEIDYELPIDNIRGADWKAAELVGISYSS